MRYVWLAVYLVVGFVIGNLVADLIVAIAIPLGAIMGQTLLILLFGGTGAFAGYGAWRRKLAPIQTDVHGSAQWATDRQVRAALGRSDGLIVGREPKRGGQLLRYGGAAHLVTIAPTRSGKGVGAITPNLLTTRALHGFGGHMPGSRRQRFGTHPVDLHLGSALRARRRTRSMSLDALAEHLGLTYQQVQKYIRARWQATPG